MRSKKRSSFSRGPRTEFTSSVTVGNLSVDGVVSPRHIVSPHVAILVVSPFSPLFSFWAGIDPEREKFPPMTKLTLPQGAESVRFVDLDAWIARNVGGFKGLYPEQTRLFEDRRLNSLGFMHFMNWVAVRPWMDMLASSADDGEVCIGLTSCPLVSGGHVNHVFYDEGLASLSRVHEAVAARGNKREAEHPVYGHMSLESSLQLFMNLKASYASRFQFQSLPEAINLLTSLNVRAVNSAFNPIRVVSKEDDPRPSDGASSTVKEGGDEAVLPGSGDSQDHVIQEEGSDED